MGEGRRVSTAERAVLGRLNGWERNFLRLYSTGDFGMVRRELGDMVGRPADAVDYGPIRYEDDAERIRQQIAAKVATFVAQQNGRPTVSARDEEAPMDDETTDHVLAWAREREAFTKRELVEAFGMGPTSVHNLVYKLVEAGEIVKAGKRLNTMGPPSLLFAATGRSSTPTEGAARSAPADVEGVQSVAAPSRPPQGGSPEASDSNGDTWQPSSPPAGDGPAITPDTAAGAASGVPTSLDEVADRVLSPGFSPAAPAQPSPPPPADEVAELRAIVTALDECRKTMARSLSELRQAVTRIEAEQEAQHDRISELLADEDDMKAMRASYSLHVEAFANLAEEVRRVRAMQESLSAQVNASDMDALDITLGAAVAGLARIGRGELDPSALVEHLTEERRRKEADRAPDD
jgi:hypothetical protein